MSRSYKKYPFTGITTAKTEKQDKRFANRRERRVNGQRLKKTYDADSLKLKRELTNVWSMGKDGKFRFDPAKFPKLMRK